MRVLIVATNRERTPMPVVPIGASVIASVTEAAGHEVRFVDFMFCRKPRRELVRAIAEFKPEVIGLSIRNLDTTSWLVSTFYLDDALEYVNLAREHGRCPVIVGGACLGVHPGGITAYVGADAGIWGDGERAFTEVLQRIGQGSPYDDVPGVVTVPAEGPPRVNPQFRVDDIGAIIRPQVWRWIDYPTYRNHTAPLPIQTRRGCVFECSYCTYTFIEGNSYRLKPIEAVVQEVRELAERFPGGNVEFVDSTFNLPLPYTVEMLDALADADLGMSYHTSGFNPAAVSRRLIESMNRAGVAQVVITPEAASDVMLSKLNKGFTKATLEKCCELRKLGNWEVMWVFMLGGPGETEETIAETFEFIEQRIPFTDLVFLQPGLRVYPNTQLHRDAVAEGVLDPDSDLIKPFYYLSQNLPELRYREIIVEQIRRHSNYMTLRDIMHPLFPMLLKLVGRLRKPAPLAGATNGLSHLNRAGLRRGGSSV